MAELIHRSSLSGRVCGSMVGAHPGRPGATCSTANQAACRRRGEPRGPRVAVSGLFSAGGGRKHATNGDLLRGSSVCAGAGGRLRRARDARLSSRPRVLAIPVLRRQPLLARRPAPRSPCATLTALCQCSAPESLSPVSLLVAEPNRQSGVQGRGDRRRGGLPRAQAQLANRVRPKSCRRYLVRRGHRAGGRPSP